jgi:hypothetical protein
MTAAAAAAAAACADGVGTHLDVTVYAPVLVHVCKPLQHCFHDGGNHWLLEALQRTSNTRDKSMAQ